MNGVVRVRRGGVRRIFLDDGIWMHETSRGYFAYHQPYLRLDLRRLDECARRNFFWGYNPRPGDVIVDVGAGVGEDTLTFSRAVGEQGQVICVEAHPRTYRCLVKMARYNALGNVIPVHAAAVELGRASVKIRDDEEYLANRLDDAAGLSVPGATIDQICEPLNLGRIHFLKMNIEGAERFAIRGMSATLQRTEVLCVSCHDFLAKSRSANGESAVESEEGFYRTKSFVRQFLRQNGLEVVERSGPGLPAYIRDQLWGFNHIPTPLS